MNFNKFTFFEFKLEKMVIDPSIVMIAKRGSGKSFITRDIIYHYRHVPGGVVIAPTDKMNSFYKYFFPDLYIHYDIKETILTKILERQRKMIQKQKEKKKLGIRIDPSGILIMDDCLARKKSWAKDESIMEILMNGRHYKLTYILTMQTPLGITPDLRLNFDYVFLLKEDSAINLKKLYENYASMFPNIYTFEKAFKKCTEDYKSMVIDNRKPSDSIQEKVFWFKAKERKFSFGSKRFKEIHKKYYDPQYMMKKSNLLDNALLLGKKRRNEVDIGINLK
ncbi:A32-like packaging ATPase [Acanthamoeba polyphaga moumouvirus]|uniref:A32-like packaging ATPase n=2 Tax=Moumouvirus TaxID=3080801 RepID=L7RCF5_9VIRU|nr:A32-like packaging ATPase [Acanthamoeba polyphaga moumouvirus]AEX62844.1 VVA32 virion packaging ATPase [Moumouvirus Monve]AGC01916.1 A32-like packaging ATPase [Acanthamoeba polyphaga moumouvirus]AQN68276.1 A32-like packaging ATPase [Saudi moumouvirus]